MDRFWTLVRWGGVALTTAVFGVLFLWIATRPGAGPAALELSHLGLIACCLGLAGHIALIWRATERQNKERPAPRTWWILLAWFGTATLLLLPGAHQPASAWLLATALGCSLLALRLRQVLCFAGLLSLAALVSDVWLRPRPALGTYALAGVMLAVAAGAIRFLYRELHLAREELSQLRREVGYLTQTNVRLQNHVIQEKELLLVRERDRIAREFHDTLGHTLTGLVVKLQAIQALVKVDPARAVEEIDSSCALVREALREARLAVSALRDPVSKVSRGRALWTALCETFAKCTGITIQTDIEEEFDGADDALNAVVYRFIQEALTNAYRHGEATLINVAVWCRDRELRVRVSDNGHGVNQLHEGFGITGIRERVTELQGQVGWRSEYGKGFDIAIVIPYGSGEERIS
ncbi:signal transduction histidine kinase [Hydrogenispora ethanolica]|uniref:histidine kinase n=1 Tax=Hydrogenispora ethanolica TaxID=1082276 RepID=A0A4R1RHB7_HYDET|nr:sensor histidine kinase [Hydrogenispora ethanolica]TCL65326.1 signal transduction histidine kinase [Hydrogenispora ethanolica]